MFKNNLKQNKTKQKSKKTILSSCARGCGVAEFKVRVMLKRKVFLEGPTRLQSKAAKIIFQQQVSYSPPGYLFVFGATIQRV